MSLSPYLCCLFKCTTGYVRVERAVWLVAFFRTCFSVFSFWRCHMSFVLMQKCFWRFLRFLPATLRAEFFELFVGLPRYFMAAITITHMHVCVSVSVSVWVHIWICTRQSQSKRFIASLPIFARGGNPQAQAGRQGNCSFVMLISLRCEFARCVIALALPLLDTFAESCT